MDVRQKLRHNEYYSLQETFDRLYAQSQQGRYFNDLIKLMRDEANIRLAYRNIKRNDGRNTPGVDGLTMKDIAILRPDEVVSRIQTMFDYYTPQPVRRKLIPKPNGKKRPLGIPCIWDRLFQQCILQVLEPICEAKFHKHSYGYRPNRSTHHAIARMNYLVYKVGLHHCVDIDIKGFFDNVNHGKLLKQLWTLGIRDKKFLSIISALIKAEIQGEGTPTKGTPQGGILSPLLSNIVLNELDWWVSNQWETIQTRHAYTQVNKNRALQTSRLKEIYIVRYADDFKILCKTRNQAIKTKFAVEQFLKERLQLDCSPEKSRIVNLKKQWSEFLGFEIKAKAKGYKENRIWKSKWVNGKDTNVLVEIKRSPKYVSVSRMSSKAKNQAKDKIRTAIKAIKINPSSNTAIRYNQTILGIHNYYKVAAFISLDLSEIGFQCRRSLSNRLRNHKTRTTLSAASQFQQRKLEGRVARLESVANVVLIPIHAQKYAAPKQFNPAICNFTASGRDIIHKKLMVTAPEILASLADHSLSNRSMEYHDNRISKFLAQYGKCYVTGIPLGYNGWHCHHINPYHISKDDSFKNLVIVTEEIHRLIHMTAREKIQTILTMLKLDKKSLNRLNSLRSKAGVKRIVFRTEIAS